MPEDLLGRLPSLHILRHQFPSFVRTLRRYYAVARLLPGVHVRITLLASRTDPQSCDQGYQRGLSVLARVVSRRAHGSRTTPDPTATRVCVPVSVAFPLQAHGRHPDCVFRSSIPGPSMPLSTLHPVPHGTQRKTRGQDGSLSGRRRRACALATVRRSNCTCGFPACSFHEDSRFRDAIEGINRIKFTSPYSRYSLVSGNCNQPPQRQRLYRCDQMRRTIQQSSRWKRVRT